MKKLDEILTEELLLIELLKFGSEKDFSGKIYHMQNDGNLNIDKSTQNYLIKKYNDHKNQVIFDQNTKFYFIFHSNIFWKSESIWREDRNYIRSAIITEKGIFSFYREDTIGTNKTPDDMSSTLWSEIDDIGLYKQIDSDSVTQYFLKIFHKSSLDETNIWLNRFGYNNLEYGRIIINTLNHLRKYFQENLKTKEDSLKDLIEEINSIIASSDKYILEKEKKEDFLKLLAELNENIDFFNDDDVLWIKLMDVVKTLNFEGIDDTIIQIDDLLELFQNNDNHEFIALLYAIKGDLLLKKGDTIRSINSYSKAEEHAGQDLKKEFRTLKEETYAKLKNEFSEISYDKRKLIFLTNQITSTIKNELILLKKNDVPVGLKFPIGHPHENEVYTCHPLKNDFYIPLKNFEKELFLDKVNEFTYLIQCLGAIKIEITSSKTNLNQYNKKINTNLDVKLDTKFSNANLNTNNLSENNNFSDEMLKIEKTQTFSPTKEPYIPENLVWYKTDLSWQRLAEQRLNGNINHHNEIITSLQNQVVSNTEVENINVELKVLLPKINVNYTKEHEININSKTSLEWVISIDFKDSSSNYSKKNMEIAPVNENLEKYKEDVLFMLEDDKVIDTNERKILDRKILKYGLSPQEAAEIEKSLIGELFNENELLYIEELKEIIEDGEITETELKVLDRYAAKFNLSNDQKEKINELFIKNI